MKNLKTKLGVIVLAILALTVMSCKDSKKGQDNEASHQSEVTKNDNASSNSIIDAYIQLKNALVLDDENGAAKAGANLEKVLKGLDITKFEEAQKKELSEILEAAIEHAEHIAKSEIEHQREHFKGLSTDMIDLIAIIGTPDTLYQQYCPMYDNGSAWLSTNKEIKNPYFGSKMLNCGKVQKEIK